MHNKLLCSQCLIGMSSVYFTDTAIHNVILPVQYMTMNLVLLSYWKYSRLQNKITVLPKG